jgi:cyclopropane-fatty-acyl-phospholipid synthase
MVVARAIDNTSHLKETIQYWLDQADVKINGDRPWDIQVHNDQLYARLIAQGTLAVGESYVEGWWDCDQLDELIARILWCNVNQAFSNWSYPQILQAKLMNLQSPHRSFEVARQHYDRGNRLYQHMLDSRMIYSCGYWKDAANLDAAQDAKLDLICRKLDIKPGMRVLDIGCGWGGAAKYIAERYPVEVVGITISEQQAQFAQNLCKGLPIEIRLQDYRELDESFDRILSVGMFEHVGYKNYRTYFQKVRNCLTEDGRFLLHTIGSNESQVRTEPWIEKYIFPNSMLPSAKQIATAIEHVLLLEDWHSFGHDYDKTLMAWFRNFDTHWHILKADYDEQFYRMWKYYLLSCAGGFRARKNQLWQILLSPKGIRGSYRVPR